MQEKLKEKIINGDYTLGEIIVPQTFEKIMMVENKLVTEEIAVDGRKIPLDEIRQSMLEKHSKYMRLSSNEELEKLSREEILDNLKQYNKHEYETIDKELILNTLKNI